MHTHHVERCAFHLQGDNQKQQGRIMIFYEVNSPVIYQGC